MLGFNKNQNEENNREVSKSSKLGRGITSVKSAKDKYFHFPDYIDPLPYCRYGVEKQLTFLGMKHIEDNEVKKKGEKLQKRKNYPLFIDPSLVSHKLLISQTRGGKGVITAYMAAQYILEGKGVIVFDPKLDDWLPMVLKMMAEEKGVKFDVCSFPNNFKYGGIHPDDSEMEIRTKLVTALSLENTGGAEDHYKKNERRILLQILEIFFKGDLTIKGEPFICKKDLKEIVKHIRYVKLDLEKQVELEKEQSKFKQNAMRVKKFKQRFFDGDSMEKIYWSSADISTLDSLSNSLAELTQGVNIYNDINIDDYLYKGGVLLVQGDMLDPAANNLFRLLQADLLIRTKKKKMWEDIEANCEVICDEAASYESPLIATSLSTCKGFGLTYTLIFQDISQIHPDRLGIYISNCNLRMFGKPSEISTLEFLNKIGGTDLVTNYSESGNSKTYSQTQEQTLNTTSLRALPGQKMWIVICDQLPNIEIINSHHVTVPHKFKWKDYQYPPEEHKSKNEERIYILNNRVNCEKVEKPISQAKKTMKDIIEAKKESIEDDGFDEFEGDEKSYFVPQYIQIESN